MFFGWLGVHRYYLGQKDWGLVYSIGSGLVLFAVRVPFIGFLLKFLWFPFMMIVSLIDAITFFSMDKERFDEKYNGIPRSSQQRPQTYFEKRRAEQQRRRDTDFERPQAERAAHRTAHRKRRHYQERPPKPKAKPRSRNNPYKKSGIEKFKEYDYVGAIKDFKKSLEIVPNDIATHFNLACAYSLTEDADNSFYHLDKAVKLGFKDTQKIKEHHGLAFLRIQPEFDEFEENGFRIPHPQPTTEKKEDDLLNTQPDLLDQLNKLGDLRKRGLLTELEFEQQKKKLLG